MKHFSYSIHLIFACLFFILTACEKSPLPILKIAATSVPHAELLEHIKPDLKSQNIDLEIMIVDDFNIPNRALADREVDANFFQHLPFLEAQQADFGYALEGFVAIHLEPMALYSKKHPSLEELKNRQTKTTIAIPSDPSNQARALILCAQLGLITLKTEGAKTNVLEIVDNPYQLHFIEMDSPLLSRALEDVDGAMISTNFAFLAGLSPKKDALAIEGSQSKFANFIVIRQNEAQRPELQALKHALTTEKVRQFIEEHYQGAVMPAF